MSFRLVCLFALFWPTLILGQDHPGEAVYDKYCAQCHGVNGDGQGPAAPFVWPKPRNFTNGIFKFRSTGPEYLPLDTDLEKVIREGIHGTSMPGFAQIGEQAIRDVVAYLPRFYQERIARDKEDGFFPPKAISYDPPPAISQELIAEGRAVYFENGCADCHGFSGRADGPSAATLEDDYGDPIMSANLSQSWRFRAGNDLEDIFKAFSTGITGTPMPFFGDDTLAEPKRWAVAAYVKSLSEDSEPEPSALIKAAFQEGDLPKSIDDPLWQDLEPAYFPMTAQIMWEPININPTVLGVEVRSLHNGESLTLLLSWDDPSFSLASTTDEADEEEDDFFGEEETATILNDSFAIQFPSGIPKINERPYFVMGEENASVNLWRWVNLGKATSEPYDGDDPEAWQRYHVAYSGPTTLQNQVASGRDSLSELDEANPLNGTLHYRNGRYSLLVTRSLAAVNAQEVTLAPGSFTPIAFWAWDGHNEEEGSKASLSSWYWLLLEKPVEKKVYAQTAAAMAFVLVAQAFAVRSARRKQRLLPTEEEEA